MNLQLSWDLFILVVFTVIIAYSFIIGKNQTLRVIIATYIAILAADSLANVFQKLLITSPTVTKFTAVAGINDPVQVLLLIKICVFIGAILLLTVRGRFDVDIPDDPILAVRVITLFIFGFLNAALIVSTIIVYVSGGSLVEGSIDLTNGIIRSIYQDSSMVRAMINYYNFWFALPALSFVAASILGRKPNTSM